MAEKIVQAGSNQLKTLGPCDVKIDLVSGLLV
jgi:hypothetical protein